MSDHAGARLTPRALAERRDRLQDRLHQASWGAIIGGIAAWGFAIAALDADPTPWQGIISLLMTGAMQFLLAYQVRERHEIAAGSMVAGFVLSNVWRWVYLSDLSGFVGFALFLALYVRGFLAAIELADLEKDYGPEPQLPF